MALSISRTDNCLLLFGFPNCFGCWSLGNGESEDFTFAVGFEVWGEWRWGREGEEELLGNAEARIWDLFMDKQFKLFIATFLVGFCSSFYNPNFFLKKMFVSNHFAVVIYDKLG